MAKYISILICVVFFSCNLKSSSRAEQDDSSKKFEEMKDTSSKLKYTHEGHFKKEHTDQDFVKQLILKQHVNGVNPYIFSLDGNFSSEGNEGKAYYKNKKVDRIEIISYRETGKAIYKYLFKNEKIAVSQLRYIYKTELTAVRSESDYTKEAEINFDTDLEGKVIGGDFAKADLDTFRELKKAIPFDLN